MVLLHILVEQPETVGHRFESVNPSCRAHKRRHKTAVVTSARSSIDASHARPNNRLHQLTDFWFVIARGHEDAHFPVAGIKPKPKSVNFSHPRKSARQDRR